MSKNIYKTVTDKLITQVETGALPWVQEWRSASGLPENAITGRQYNGINTLILWLMADELGFSSNRWCTFNQAKNAGAFVRKGEAAIPVIFYKPLTKEVENSDGNLEEKNIPMMRVFNVFNTDQIEGYEASENECIEVLPSIDDFIKATGVKTIHGSPAYSPSVDLVKMPPVDKFKTTEGYYATFFHELVHWTKHKTRLDRKMESKFEKGGYAMEELVAEIGAAFLCAKFGVPGEVRHAGYIKDWLEVVKEDEKAIFKAAAEASKAVEYLLASFNE